MKKNFIGVLCALFLLGVYPNGLQADEEIIPPAEDTVEVVETTTETPEEAAPTPPAPVTIPVNLNIRYQGSLVWTGAVDLPQGSTLGVADKTGSVRTIPSDSALAALVTADAVSTDFTVSELTYYDSIGSLFINCIDIAAISKHACNNWQYVVNSEYPSFGADKYTLTGNETIYYYFGNPRRVTLSKSTEEADKPILVTTETYDYTNNTWKVLSGAQIGVTEPNPDDPFSPLVRQTVTSNESGTVEVRIATPGTYSIGLAIDYYYPSEALTITPAVVETSNASIPTPEEPRTTATGSGTSGGSSGGSSPITATTETPTTILNATTVQTESTPEITNIIVTFPLSTEDFTERYIAALNSMPVPVPYSQPIPQKETRPQNNQQIASVIGAIELPLPGTSTAAVKTTSSGFSKILNFFTSIIKGQ